VALSFESMSGYDIKN